MEMRRTNAKNQTIVQTVLPLHALVPSFLDTRKLQLTQQLQLFPGVRPEGRGEEAVVLNLARRVRIPLASGEHFQTRQQDPGRDATLRIGHVQDSDLLHAVVQESQGSFRHLRKDSKWNIRQ